MYYFTNEATISQIPTPSIHGKRYKVSKRTKPGSVGEEIHKSFFWGFFGGAATCRMKMFQAFVEQMSFKRDRQPMLARALHSLRVSMKRPMAPKPVL